LNFLFQAVIDANIFPVLIDILGKAEFKTRKEAAWAITNATSGGTAEQIRYLVDQSCIPPLCDLLTVMDGKIVQVALNGLENILRLGDQDAKAHKGVNPYAVLIEECYGELKDIHRFISVRFFLYCEGVKNIHIATSLYYGLFCIALS
jgi:importin subunit alpha-2